MTEMGAAVLFLEQKFGIPTLPAHYEKKSGVGDESLLDIRNLINMTV